MERGMGRDSRRRVSFRAVKAVGGEGDVRSSRAPGPQPEWACPRVQTHLQSDLFYCFINLFKKLMFFQEVFNRPNAFFEINNSNQHLETVC
jgi:hypothetical protein